MFSLQNPSIFIINLIRATRSISEDAVRDAIALTWELCLPHTSCLSNHLKHLATVYTRIIFWLLVALSSKFRIMKTVRQVSRSFIIIGPPISNSTRMALIHSTTGTSSCQVPIKLHIFSLNIYNLNSKPLFFFQRNYILIQFCCLPFS